MRLSAGKIRNAPGVTEGCQFLRRHVVGIGGAVCAPADAVAVTVKPAAAVSAPNIPSKNVRRSIASSCGLRPIIVGRR